VLGCALLSCGDLFHSTSWDPPQCPPGEACAAPGGAGGALAEGGAGAASPAAGGAGGAGNGGPGPGGPGGGGSCPATEDCLTPADDDCGDDANAGCGLILYLAFDEGAGGVAVDSSGRGNDGAHSSTYVAGVRGSALSFDGSTGVIIDASPDLVWGADGEPFTVAFWLRVTGAPTTFWRGLMHKGNTDCGVGDRTGAMFLAPMGQTMHTAVSSASVVDPMLCYQYALNSGEVPVDQWLHVALVVDGLEMRLYFDGVLDASVAADNVVSSEAPVYIGHDPFYTGLLGDMDELQIYDRALSEAEIGALMTPP
jgi:hypothetical protein